MGDAVIVVCPPDTGADWRDAVIITVNPAACTMLGRKQDEILGQPVGRLIQEHHRGASGPAGERVIWLEEVLKHGHIGSREVVYKIRDGREIPSCSRARHAARRECDTGHRLRGARSDRDQAMEARGAFIRETFGRYVSDDVVASLLSSPEALKLGGEQRKVTVMMSDLRGFTALAERLTPEEAIRFLNGYCRRWSTSSSATAGPSTRSWATDPRHLRGAQAAADDAERAVACGVAMQRAMDEVNARGRERGLPEVEMGIVSTPRGDRRQHRLGPAHEVRRRRTDVNLTGRIESYTTGGQISSRRARCRRSRRSSSGSPAAHRAEGGQARDDRVEVSASAARTTHPARVERDGRLAKEIRFATRYWRKSTWVGPCSTRASCASPARRRSPVSRAGAAPQESKNLDSRDRAGAPPVELYAKWSKYSRRRTGFTVRFTSMAPR